MGGFAIQKRVSEEIERKVSTDLGKKVAEKTGKSGEARLSETGSKLAADSVKLTHLAEGKLSQVIKAQPVATAVESHLAEAAPDSLLRRMINTPLTIGARVLDYATGHTHVNIDSHHTVVGTSSAKWADAFLKDPSKISPLASNARQVGNVAMGRPFPNGPDIGIKLTGRHEGKTAEGLAQTVLDIEYSGSFEGPGRITVTQQTDGMLDVRDEWLNLVNKSILPSAAAEIGHPKVAGLGFKGIGERTQGGSGVQVVDVAKTLASVPFTLMKIPFSFLPF